MLPSDWTDREAIRKHSLNMRQFADFRQATLPDGQRIVEAYNASGLNYVVLPDRGLDIWSAHYRGIPLTWLSQGAPHAPEPGLTWLRGFNGGVLVTCGLTHAGPPEQQPLTDGGRDLHGLYTFLPAFDVATHSGWQGDDYALTLSGVVSENRLFGEQLRLERTFRLSLDQPVIEFADHVVNLGDEPIPVMVLYHLNFGYPLIRQGTKLVTPSEAVVPRTDEAVKGQARWAEYDAAIPGFAEQVWFHVVRADADGQTTVALMQPEFGLRFDYNTRTLPFLTQWKNIRQGIYVCGVEPGNCLPEGQVKARDKGRLDVLEPGESIDFAIKLTVLDGADAIAQTRDRIDQLAASGTAVPGLDLSDYPM